MEIDIYDSEKSIEVEEHFSPTQLKLGPSPNFTTSPNSLLVLLLASFLIIMSISFIAYRRVKTIKHRKDYMNVEWTP